MLLNRGPNAFGTGFVLPNGTEPLAFADFKNGAYEIDGSAASFDDLFAEDPDWGTFDPSNIVADTGLSGSNEPSLRVAPAVEAGLLSGVTIVAQYSTTGSSSDRLVIEILDLPGYTNELRFRYSSNAISLTYAGSGETLAIQRMQVAINLSQTRGAVSLNGREPLAADFDPGAAANALALTVSNGMVLENIAFYPLQDEADLAAVIDTPVVLTPPAITGDPVVGATLTVTPGTWDNSPSSFSYSWTSSTNFEIGTDSNTYVVEPSEEGTAAIVCTVIASNDHGDEIVETTNFGPITAA